MKFPQDLVIILVKIREVAYPTGNFLLFYLVLHFSIYLTIEHQYHCTFNLLRLEITLFPIPFLKFPSQLFVFSVRFHATNHARPDTFSFNLPFNQLLSSSTWCFYCSPVETTVTLLTLAELRRTSNRRPNVYFHQIGDVDSLIS